MVVTARLVPTTLHLDGVSEVIEFKLFVEKESVGQKDERCRSLQQCCRFIQRVWAWVFAVAYPRGLVRPPFRPRS
jgi:hypothetical protein